MNLTSDSGKLRIMLVETEEYDCAAMRLLIMEIAPHQTDVFWSQAYAFALNDVRRKPLDLIMINFYLGRYRNGFALAEELRSRGCQLPIVLFGRSETLADLPMQSNVDILNIDRKLPEQLRHLLHDHLGRIAPRQAARLRSITTTETEVGEVSEVSASR
jgi:hypothetical protein